MRGCECDRATEGDFVQVGGGERSTTVSKRGSSVQPSRIRELPNAVFFIRVIDFYQLPFDAMAVIMLRESTDPSCFVPMLCG